MKRDPYHVLLVRRGANTQEIDAAYLRLLKAVGFFLEPGSKPYREARQVAVESHKILTTSWMRYSYDRYGHDFWSMNLWALREQYNGFLARQREWERAQGEWRAAPEACVDGKGGIVFRAPPRVYDDRPLPKALPPRPPRNRIVMPPAADHKAAVRYV